MLCFIFFLQIITNIKNTMYNKQKYKTDTEIISVYIGRYTGHCIL